MIFWLIFILISLVIIFGVAITVGPPYLPTLRKQINTALDLLDLQPGQTLLELGSGDGRVMLAAAQRGLKVIGIEINPLLVVLSWLLTFRYRNQVRIIWGSYWGPPWPRADGVFTFMLPRYMEKLHQRMEHWRPQPIRLASFAFTIPGKEPIASKDGVYLYEYK
jgi:SAM-dependent methyltransferase